MKRHIIQIYAEAVGNISICISICDRTSREIPFYSMVLVKYDGNWVIEMRIGLGECLLSVCYVLRLTSTELFKAFPLTKDI